MQDLEDELFAARNEALKVARSHAATARERLSMGHRRARLTYSLPSAPSAR
jgi:hypothetical protein